VINPIPACLGWLAMVAVTFMLARREFRIRAGAAVIIVLTAVAGQVLALFMFVAVQQLTAPWFTGG
jgi:hypothetical protein